MLNQVIIAGRIVNIKEITNNCTGKTKAEMIVAVPRSYKNIDGNYETDFIACTIWGEIAQTTMEYCKQGDIVGVKGRIETQPSINSDNSTSYKMEIVAEKVSFLSSGKHN